MRLDAAPRLAPRLLVLLLALPSGGPARGGEPERARKNLISNGDFEAAGRGGGPAGWQRPDGLTSFWVAAPGRKGKCIKIDTDVLASQFRAREDEMDRAKAEGREPAPPPRRAPTTPPRYDTVAGLDGVHFGCDPIPFEPGKRYLLEVDVRVEGEASPKVWVKGFGEVKSRDLKRERQLWKKSLNCEKAGRDWTTFRMVFPRDTAIPKAVERIRLYLYPYWPPATYYFDNVRLFEISEEEAKRFDPERDLRASPPKTS
jgi:hypothetical protein